MTDPIQLVSIAVSGLLFLLVMELVRRRTLTEEYSLLWLLGSLVLMAVSIWRESLDLVARWLGVYYPPAILLLLVTLLGFIGLLSFSVVVSTQRRQIEQLVVELALLEARLREVESDASEAAE